MLPINKDLSASGHTTQELLDPVLDPVTPHFYKRTSASWVVRWQGRVISLDGHTVFTSQATAEARVKHWFRGVLRYATPYQWYMATTGHIQLPRTWTAKKTFRTFVDEIVEHLTREGVIQYQEVDPPARTQTLA